MEIKRELLEKRIKELNDAVDERRLKYHQALGALTEAQAMLNFLNRPDQPVEVVSVSPVEEPEQPVEAGGSANGTRGSAEEAE
jgi:hypothetical protein